jgi:predicted NAD/FAD-dependent oxidoreductase
MQHYMYIAALRWRVSLLMLDSCAYRIAVIGAGVAGGTCASRLLRLPGVSTTVYDMGSRGPGGRASSRLVDGKGGSFSPDDRGGASSLLAPVGAALTFDHGVQAFSVEAGREVAELVEGWVRAGHAQAWEGAFGLLDANTGRFAPSAQPANDDALFGPLVSAGQRYVGVPTMAALVSGMLETAAAEAEAAAAGASLTALWGCKASAITHTVEGEAPSGARWSVASSDGLSRSFDAVVLATHAAPPRPA